MKKPLTDRVYLLKCVGKIMAYWQLYNIEEAKIWAKNLVERLEKMGLVS